MPAALLPAVSLLRRAATKSPVATLRALATLPRAVATQLRVVTARITHAANRVVRAARAANERVCAAGAQAGMSTAEYAVGLVAACAFAAVLYKILTSGTMQSLLRGLISRALHVTL